MNTTKKTMTTTPPLPANNFLASLRYDFPNGYIQWKDYEATLVYNHPPFGTMKVKSSLTFPHRFRILLGGKETIADNLTADEIRATLNSATK
jgi:hypothetical protein